MTCPHCRNSTDDQYLRCEHCNQRLFEADTIEELWAKFKNEKIKGAYLELVYRAFNTRKEKEQAWRTIYPRIHDNIKFYLHCNPCTRMTWLLYRNGWTDEDIIQKVLKGNPG